MALITSGFTTYTAIGNREDLSDVIRNISPVETQFQSLIGDVAAKARYHEWQTDALAAPAANVQFEGNEASATAITASTRLGNYCQILSKSFAITKTQEVVDKAGRKSELAYQTALKLKEIATDIEYALMINSAAVSGATGTARQLKGVLGFIATNVTTATATTVALNETQFTDNLALIWAAGGKPSNVFCGATQKRKIDAFTGGNTRYIDIKASDIQSAVDVYRSSFGKLNVHLHFILNTAAADTVVIIGQVEQWRKAYLRKPARVDLAVTGDSLRFLLVTELTLEAGNEKSSGKLTGFAP